MRARIYLVAGWISVALGIIGIPLPLLPTTPFLLLAAFCFARGSQRWHDWLVQHRVLGAYITAFRDQKGLTVKQKWRIAIWIIISLSLGAWFSPMLIGRICIAIIGAFWLRWIYRYPTALAALAALAAPTVPTSSAQPPALEETRDNPN